MATIVGFFFYHCNISFALSFHISLTWAIWVHREEIWFIFPDHNFSITKLISIINDLQLYGKTGAKSPSEL